MNAIETDEWKREFEKEFTEFMDSIGYITDCAGRLDNYKLSHTRSNGMGRILDFDICKTIDRDRAPDFHSRHAYPPKIQSMQTLFTTA